MPSVAREPDAKTWQFTPDKLTALLGTDSERGLAGQEVERHHAEFGPNELPEAPPPSLLKLFLSQFTSVIVWVLIGAAIISGLLEDWLDAAAILAIVFLNGLLGFVPRVPCRAVLGRASKMSVATARVIRDGVLRSSPRANWCPEMSFSWKPATVSRRMLGSSTPRISRFKKRR